MVGLVVEIMMFIVKLKNKIIQDCDVFMVQLGWFVFMKVVIIKKMSVWIWNWVKRFNSSGYVDDQYYWFIVESYFVDMILYQRDSFQRFKQFVVRDYVFWWWLC